MHRYRTHTCGELRKEQIDETVKISGWVHSVRDHGGIIFIDLRDHYGLTQVVIDPSQPFYKGVEHWRVESTICFTGKVVARFEEAVNPNLATGEIELVAEEMETLGEAKVIPFQVSKDEDCNEALRLEYRFLDMRRESLHNNLILRSKVISRLRELMTGEGFMEMQTPILTGSSPEGARDYLVPSRVHPGKFYALPQAPQQFKQLLMTSGFDRYFQIAPCFRDEDARADRSPGEFYQLDMELAFATQEDVFEVNEKVLHKVFTEFSDKQVDDIPFKRLPFKEAMEKYGTDKPDLRNPLIIQDASEIFRDCGFKAFAGVVASGGAVKTIAAKGCADKSRKFFDDLIKFAQGVGSKGLGYLCFLKDGEIKSPIAKFLSEDEIAKLKELGNVEDGDVMFFIADKAKEATEIGSHVRDELGKRLELIDPNVFKFCWIVDFPMYELDDDGKVEFSHNPFSMPQGGMDDLENKDPLEILAYQYDIVVNGVELSSGAVRNHSPEMMIKAFDIAGYDETVVANKFPALHKAFQYGAPPHAGIAPGVDRMVMLLADEPNIREVIAFPMNQKAQDLLMNAPGDVEFNQIRDLHLRLHLPKKAEKEEGKDETAD